MADALNYLSLISAMNYPNNVQGLYSAYNPYSAAYLYNGTEEDSFSFSNIFGSCINAFNTSLLSGLANSNNSISDTDSKQFIENLEEASKDTCDCKSADLAKELYSAYLSNTVGYAKNYLNQLTKSVNSGLDQSQNIQNKTSTNHQEPTAVVNTSIPSEEEIDKMITESVSIPTLF